MSGSAIDILVWLPEYQVLVCRQHKTAVQNLNTHLCRQHSLPVTEKKQLLKEFKEKNSLPPDEIRLPAAGSAVIAELGEPLEGLQCVQTGCDYTTININELRSTLR